MIIVAVFVETNGERTAIETERDLSEDRVVDLQRRSVVPRFGVTRCASEEAIATQRAVDLEMARSCRAIDRAALRRLDENVAAGRQKIRGDVAVPTAVCDRNEQRAGRGALRSGIDIDRD